MKLMLTILCEVRLGNESINKTVNTSSIVINNLISSDSCLPVYVNITAHNGIISSNKTQTVIYYPQGMTFIYLFIVPYYSLAPINCSLLTNKITTIDEGKAVLNLTYKVSR